MKLFNVITIHDIYVLAEDHDDARATADTVIRGGEQPVYEQVAYEINTEKGIREDWREQAPWVSEKYPDYAPEGGETVLQAFQRIYTKRG